MSAMKRILKLYNKLYYLLMALQESGMTLITAEDLDDAAKKAVEAISK